VKFEPDSFFEFEAYDEALDALHIASGVMLFDFGLGNEDARNLICRNFVARTDMTASAIFRLYQMRDYQDCWILYRCLLDRLFHLRNLADTDGFDVFEAWSFLEQYRGLNRVRSDPEVEGARDHELFTPTEDQKKRACELSAMPPAWKRPRAEDVAKEMDMRFLYVHGYDFASTHVHPMANDGDQDFYTITGIESAHSFPDQRMILSNTLLATTLVAQTALNASALAWRNVVYDFLGDIRQFLLTGAKDYRVSALKLGYAFRDGTHMCEPSTSEDGGADTV